jgi:hypothetical protein
MHEEKAGLPELDNDPVIQYLLSGAASSLYEAEEMYLDASLPQLLQLLRGPLTDEELSRHPLVQLMLSHGSRGREDSLP